MCRLWAGHWRCKCQRYRQAALAMWQFVPCCWYNAAGRAPASSSSRGRVGAHTGPSWRRGLQHPTPPPPFPRQGASCMNSALCCKEASHISTLSGDLRWFHRRSQQAPGTEPTPPARHSPEAIGCSTVTPTLPPPACAPHLVVAARLLVAAMQGVRPLEAGDYDKGRCLRPLRQAGGV